MYENVKKPTLLKDSNSRPCSHITKNWRLLKEYYFVVKVKKSFKQFILNTVPVILINIAIGRGIQ